MARLRLEIIDFGDLDHWRWRLTEPEGAFVADHVVRLDPGSPERARFHDLDPTLSDREIDAVGRWIGEQVLGTIGPAVVARAPATVDVHVPRGAEALLTRPLELGHVGGRPLALHDVSLAWEPPGCPPVAKRAPGKRLRMLAIFSVPTDVAGLAVRRERYELARYVVEKIVARQNRAIEFRVIQYGVTRDRLREVLQEGDGWDIVHFSGHGLAGGLVLETEEGRPDLVRTDDLVELLHPGRDQIRLVTLFSCLSAAGVAAETLRGLGLPVEPDVEPGVRVPALPLPALATRLTCRLGCAVLAMRHPIRDGYAVDLAVRLYHLLLDSGQLLPRAVQLAIAAAGSAGALAPATPALFGGLASDLRFEPPAGTPLYFDPEKLRAAGLPREPERFVGRVVPLARAGRALAAGSGQSGVLFHGSAGCGKSTCAAELAYGHQESFGLVFWHDLPRAGADISGALLAFARALDERLQGLRLAERVPSRERFEAFLPRLAAFLERHGVLLVIDNLDSLLTEAGGWRDDRWASLMAALTRHRGQSRVVLASRVVPAALDHGVQLEEIGPLSRPELALLARELPRLGALIRGDDTDRAQVRLALERSDGSPARLVEFDRAPPVVVTPPRAIDMLRGRMDILLARADMLGLGEHRELSALAVVAEDRLYSGPIDVAAAEAAVTAYHELLARLDQWTAAADG